MSRLRNLRNLVAIVVVAGVTISGVAVPFSSAADPRLEEKVTPIAASDPDPESDGAVPEEERDRQIGPDWQKQDDLAWAVTGDARALRVLVSEAADGFAWRELAALSVEGYETDRWIGNACLTSDRRNLAVVFAPRSFTNDETFSSRGAFGAVVDTSSGSVHILDGGFSLAYFNPSCGIDGWASFSQFGDAGQTRVVSTRGSGGSTLEAVATEDYITSAIRSEYGLVGASGGAIVRLDVDGQATVLESTKGTAYSLATTQSGLAYGEVASEADATVQLLSGQGDQTDSRTLATGSLTELDVTADSNGTPYILGSPTGLSDDLPPGTQVVEDGKPGSDISSDGGLLVEQAAVADSSVQKEQSAIELEARSLQSGDELSFRLEVGLEDLSTSTPVHRAFAEQPATDITLRTEQFGVTASAASISKASWDAVEGHEAVEAFVNPANATDPSYSLSPCAVVRNSATNQALQPRPAQVEWAVDQAVRGALVAPRPANWMNLGMPQYSPQGLFPLPALAGGGRVPAPILLGILSQESNLSQASYYTVPGVTGNPLVGNYYGVDESSTSSSAWWNIDYSKADCGYGVGQVTDGMRSGSMPYAQQRAIALDYEANIARSLQILIEKWNTIRSAGMLINDGNPKYMENWFFALWAYNTGWHAQAGAGQPWGVGWSNNPANPIYPPFRTSFLDGSPNDAAHPQDWPYQEKVLGYAAYSVLLLDHVTQTGSADNFSYPSAFAPAWWTSADGNQGKTFRRSVKPPISTFCQPSNNCDLTQVYTPDVPGQPPGPCFAKDAAGKFDLRCWFHVSAIWKTDCSTMCGYESLTYAVDTTGSTRPANATSFPPNCLINDLPSGALVIDNLPNGSSPVRPGCSSPIASRGSFTFTFADDGTQRYPSRVDLHQLGSGLNGQFYFTHTRVPGTENAFAGKLNVTGKWTLGQSLNSWARVFVHMPNHGAWAQQASYSISTGLATVERSVSQRNYANRWVSLGTLQFNGSPSISLSNSSSRYARGSGVEDIAWDAVAFVPLAQKPSDFVVALGDSYSSGEGTSPPDGGGFFPSTDNNGLDGVHQNSCHRSKEAWPFKLDLPSLSGSESIRTLVDQNDPRLDFQLLACSGATTSNVRSRPAAEVSNSRFGEDNQLNRGFLDNNTTLVTLTIGGNDLGFEPIISACALSAPPGSQDCAAQVDAPAGVFPPGYPANASKKLGAVVDAKLPYVQSQVLETLREIRAKAPAARILMLGYPTIFETYQTSCVIVSPTAANRDWFNGVANRLNTTLTAAAEAAGANVTYQNPQYRFAGKNLCSPSAAVNAMIWQLTPGDSPLARWPLPGPDGKFGASAQSVHPNVAGSALYASVASAALSSTKVPLSASLTGGATTTYYSTFRLHVSPGPAAFNITSFSTCGTEIRIGLRQSSDPATNQALGQQHTTFLSWTKPNQMQTFARLDNGSPDLAVGWYAVNGRLVSPCAGGSPQPWSGSLYW